MTNDRHRRYFILKTRYYRFWLKLSCLKFMTYSSVITNLIATRIMIRIYLSGVGILFTIIMKPFPWYLLLYLRFLVFVLHLHPQNISSLDNVHINAGLVSVRKRLLVSFALLRENVALLIINCGISTFDLSYDRNVLKFVRSWNIFVHDWITLMVNKIYHFNAVNWLNKFWTISILWKVQILNILRKGCERIFWNRTDF